MLSYTGFSYGWDNLAIAAILALLWVVVNDAKSLRRLVGRHSVHLNNLDSSHNHRERVGHTLIEIAGGAIAGFVTGYICTIVLNKPAFIFLS